MSPASTPSTSALPTSSSGPSTTRKFTWDWADDDNDDGWLDDAPYDIDFSSPLSSMTPISSGSASNSLALTFSKPKASSPLSQPPTAAPIKPRPLTTSFSEALQYNIHSEAPRLQLTNPLSNIHRSIPPSKPAWRTVSKPPTLDLRAGRFPPIDLSDDDPSSLNSAPSTEFNELDSQEQSSFTASPTDSSPKPALLSLKQRPGSSKLRARRDKSTLDKALSAEVAKLAEKKKSQLCLAYVSGSCPRGENCLYMHYDVVVAPADAVETYEDSGLADLSEPNLIKVHSTVLFTNEDVPKVPFHNPFSPPQFDTSNSLIFSALPPPTELQSLFINHPSETNLPSLQADGWWDKAEHAVPAPPPKSQRDSTANLQFSPRLNVLNDSNLPTPSTGSSGKRQRPPRLHLMESNLGSKWHTHPRGAPTALSRYSFPTVPDTIVAPVSDVLYAPTDRTGADGSLREASRTRRWSIDGSMHGYKPGPCKYFQVSEPCPFGDRCPFEHSTPQYRAPPPIEQPSSETETHHPSFESDQVHTVESQPSTPHPPPPPEAAPSTSAIMPESTSNPTGLTIYPTARVLSGGIRFGDMVSLTSKKGRRAVRAQAELPKGMKVRDINAGVIMVDAELEVAIEKERQRAVAQQSQEQPRSKVNTSRRGSQQSLAPKRRGSRTSATPTRRSSVASSSMLSTASESDVVCGMYKATGQCRFGSSCKFRHDIEPLNLPGAKGSFEVFGTKKPIPGSQPGTSTAGSKRRGSMPLTPQSSSSLSLAEPPLQTPSSTSLPHRLSQLLPQGSPAGALPRMRRSQALYFPTLTPSRRASSITSDSTGSDFPLNFQSRHPSLDRIDIVAYPDAEQAASMDGEQEDMVNAAILQSIMRVPTPALKPRDKPEYKTLSGLILAESTEPSTII